MINDEFQNRGLIDRLVPVSDLQRAPGKVLEQVRRSQEPIWVTQRGRVAAVLIRPDRYGELLSQTSTGDEGSERRKRELLQALEEMLPVIVQRYGPEKIILFGSLAEGRVQEKSDIDLLVVKKTRKRPIDRRKKLLQLVRPKVATDFFVYTPEEWERGRSEGRAFFLKEIGEKGKILYERTS